MRKFVYFILLGFPLIFCSCNADNSAKAEKSEVSTSKVIALTNDTFKQLVFNYEINKQWKFEGNLPLIIDFYADWCGPCRQLSPRIEEIAREYAGKIIVYKVDTDKEKLLAQKMGIQSLPTLVFIPVNGQPQASMGALPKETLVKYVNDFLLVK